MFRTVLFHTLFLSFAFVSCAQNSKSEQKPTESSSKVEVVGSVKTNVNSTELKQLLKNEQGITIIDVRTPGEIAQGKIAGAIELNISDPAFQQKINELDKSKHYVVYCKVGGRSAKAQQIMIGEGFEKVTNLSGGYDGWKASGN
ncbi:MAG: rhodanese-like domain-containing protein [Saprospiraceae bacterium]|nr:rhodanese-like domain-containing protein [Saprospiraceae bacterium]